MHAKFLLVLVSSVFAFSSCNVIPGLGQPGEPGAARFLSAVPDMPGGFNVFFGDTKQNTAPVAFKGAFPATGYQSVPAGALKFSLCEVDKPSCTKPNQSVEVPSLKNVTVVLLGTKDAGDDGGNNPRPLEVVRLEDDLSLPGAGNAKIRLLHAASLAAANKVDVYVTQPNDALTGQPAELEYRKTNVPRNFPAGSLRIRVTPPGDASTVLIDSGTINVVSGAVHTVLITNPEAGGTGGITLITDR